MNAEERIRHALDLFDALIELDTAARETRLRRIASEEPELLAQVVALLDADASSGVLERSMTSLLPPVDDRHDLPERIGPWRITGIAGRGGMGAVYLGERADGQFQQRAAIKLIRVGMDTPQLRARFLRERQILAALEHPNIAALLDGGVTDTGAPYFAMQRVDGEPIDVWCDAHRATLRARVELFLQVCAAVQYAHQNLIVHRDLKPANIFIDADGQAKLLDFGIAKLLEAETPELTNERPHTPDYAAPEQLSGAPITTATDVYGLGVVLHGLLSGRPPRESREPLSQAVTSASVEAARARGLTATQLARAVRGDLNAIVQQCLCEEPSRRYASVSALAQDLRAWLDGQPVTAQSLTRSYLLRKFIARNRFGVLATAVLMLAIVGGVSGVLWQASKARAAAAEAQAQLDYLRHLLQVLAPSTAEARELDRSRLIAEATRRARAELADNPKSLAGVELALAQVAMGVGDYPAAMDLADSAYALRVRAFGASSLPAMEVAVLAGAARIQVSPPRFEEAQKMLDEAVVFIRRAAPDSALLVEALQKRATIYGEQGKLAEQERSITEAAALCEHPAGRVAACEDAWLELGSIASQQHKPERALAPYKRAYESKRARLGEEHAMTLNVASILAWTQAEAGDLQGGLQLAEHVHAAYQRIFTQPNETSLRAELRLFRLLKRAGQADRAVTLIDDYVAQAQRVFGEHNPNTALGYSDRGSMLFNLGRFDEAAAQFGVATREYRALKNDINASLTQTYQGESLREAGRPAEGLPLQTESVEALRKLYAKGEHILLGRALTSLALTESALGHLERALALHSEATEMQRKLHAPGATHAANAQAFRGKALFDLGKRAEAEAELRAAERELAPLKADAPNQYWEPLALLTTVACANGASDCEALRTQLREAPKLSFAASTRLRIEAALNGK